MEGKHKEAIFEILVACTWCLPKSYTWVIFEVRRLWHAEVNNRRCLIAYDELVMVMKTLFGAKARQETLTNDTIFTIGKQMYSKKVFCKWFIYPISFRCEYNRDWKLQHHVLRTGDSRNANWSDRFRDKVHPVTKGWRRVKFLFIAGAGSETWLWTILNE